MLSALRRRRAGRARRPRGEGGFTAIELMVVLGVMSVVAVTLGDVLISTTRASNNTEALVANEQSTVLTLTQLARDLRAASQLTYAVPTEVAFNKVSAAAGRTVTNAAITVASTTVTAAGGSFSSADINALVTAPGIPAGSYVTGVPSSSAITLSQPAWATNSNVTLTVAQTVAVDWRFNPSNKTLTRTLTVGAGPSSANVIMRGVMNTASQPVFRFYGPASASLVGTGPDMVAAGLPMTDIVACTTKVTAELHGDANPGPTPFQENQDIQLRNQVAALAGSNAC